MGKKPPVGEMCPFCGAYFKTGIMRGHHVRAVHREVTRALLSEMLSDMDQAALNERRFVSEGDLEAAANAG